MQQIRTIIVPVDFLEHTDQLLDFAGYIAQKLGAALHCIHVVETHQKYAGYEAPSLSSLDREMAELAEQQMQLLVDKNQRTLPNWEGKVLKGDTVGTIIQYAKDEQGDLIVIGTHGRKGLSKMWLGSVAERVIKRAPCPTLTCNPYRPES